MNELITTPCEVIFAPDFNDSDSAGTEVISAEVIDDSYCRNCGKSVTLEDNFCGKCGQGRRDLINVAVPTHSGSTGLQAVDTVLNSRLAVIGLIAVLGPIGFLALWFSPRFSKPTKIISTVFYIGVAVIMPIAIAWYWLDYSVRPLVDVLGK